MRRYLLIILSLIFFALLACSPKLNKRDFSSPLMELKPELINENDNFNKLNVNSGAFSLSWDGDIATSEVHNVIADMLELGTISKNENIKKIALKIYKKLYDVDVAIKAPFTETPYMMYFKELSTPEVKNSLNDLDKSLDANLLNIKQELQKIKKKISWPVKSRFENSISILSQYLDTFIQAISYLNLSKVFEKELKEQIETEKSEILQLLNGYLVKIRSEETLDSMLKIIESMVKDFEIKLDLKTLEKIAKGKKLTVEINEVTDEMSALKAIIAIWLFLDENERADYIKPISSALHFYLNGKSEQELSCLLQKECAGVFSVLVRDLGVLPQIKKFGVDNIKKTLNKKTHNYALGILEDNLLQTIKGIDERIYSKVKISVHRGKDQIEKINQNTSEFINEKVSNWVRNNFDGGNLLINAYDLERINVQFHNRELKFNSYKNKLNQISSRTIGTSLRVSALLWENNLLGENEFKRNALEQINKIMGFGGLPSVQGPTPGIVLDFDGSDEKYDLSQSLKSAFSFGIADNVLLSKPYEASKEIKSSNISAINQAELIYGLVHFIDYLKDWNENKFDKYLGAIKSSEIFQTESNATNDKNVFPKVQFFGLAVGQLTNIISNLNKQFSQIALMTNEADKIWINEFLKNKEKKVLYGAYVDIINGSRGEEISTESLYHLILVLKKLMSVVNGIEKTKFSELQKKDLSSSQCANPKSSECKTYAQLMADNIHQLKRIFLPLGNTLATKLRRAKDQESSGAAYRVISTRDFQPTSRDYRLEDQLMIIESLVYIYEITGLETYLWSAKETFNFLQKYYNPKTNFFNLNSQEITIPRVILSLKSFKSINKYLEEKEKIILAEKFKVWEYALERIN